jgi:hypothetical protein
LQPEIYRIPRGHKVACAIESFFEKVSPQKADKSGCGFNPTRFF